MPSLYVERFCIGHVFTYDIRRTITDIDNTPFSSLTYNPAAIHIDHSYAATTVFDRPFMNPIFTHGLIIGPWMRDIDFGTTVANFGTEETTFPKPVFADDTIRAETKCSSYDLPSRGLGRRSSPSSTSAGTIWDEIVGRMLRNALMLADPGL